MVYHNDSSTESRFEPYNSSGVDSDYLAVVLTGAAPSANVLQITLNY